ncbi:MAG: SRPBCC domain-containing protein [Opitutaceae bacterium]
MASKKPSPAKKSAARGFTLTRVFDAPRSLVFAAWTQPEHLKRWSAPQGFTIPVSKGDLRPGGQWRACMVSEQTGKLWLSGVYREIVPNKLLVFTHAWESEGGTRETETLVTVRFSDVGKKTKMVMEQTGFESADSSQGHQGGWTECLEKLAALLTGLQKAPGTEKKAIGLQPKPRAKAAAK